MSFSFPLKVRYSVFSCISALCALYFPEYKAANDVTNILWPQDGVVDLLTNINWLLKTK